MEYKKGMISMTGEQRIFPPSAELSKQAHIKSMEEYRALYRESIDDPEGFWGRLAEEVAWFRKWDRVQVDDFAHARHAWFVGGKLNAAYNCLDRHLQGARKDKVALLWEGEPEGETITIPDHVQFVNVISRTIQGKTMRRILRKIAEGDIRDLGDTSTLADRSVVDSLLEGRR
ncbi:MAG: hypothetical protein MUP30_03255 [Deltaproteobacteria bacterium]|nr:hypothetical protein [Deltaproteobacteria bacterium]